MVSEARVDVVIERATMIRALSFVAKFAAHAGVHPIYESVKLTAGATLALRATDLETAATGIVEGAHVVGEGEICASAARLLAAVQKVRADEIRLTHEGTMLILRAKRTRIEIPTHSPADFPEIVEVKPSATMAAADLAGSLGVVGYACARERMRFALNGALIDAADGKVTFVATDGRRMALTRSAMQGSLPLTILPRKALSLLATALPREGSIEIGAERSHVGFAWAGHALVTRPLDGSFPNYRGVIPQNPPHRAEVCREDMLAALDAALVVLTKLDIGARLTFAPGTLAIVTKSQEGGTRAEIDAATESSAVIGLNAEFLRDLVNAAQGDRITFQWVNPRTPLMVECGESVHVCMPISLD